MLTKEEKQKVVESTIVEILSSPDIYMETRDKCYPTLKDVLEVLKK